MCLSAAWFKGTGLLNMHCSYALSIVSAQTDNSSERPKEKNANQDNKLSCGKLSYCYMAESKVSTEILRPRRPGAVVLRAKQGHY